MMGRGRPDKRSKMNDMMGMLGRDRHGRHGRFEDEFDHYGREYMRPESPKRPDYPPEKETYQLVKPNVVEWEAMKPQGWDMKWDAINKMYHDFVENRVKNKRLSKPMSKSHTPDKCWCSFCVTLVNQEVMCHNSKCNVLICRECVPDLHAQNARYASNQAMGPRCKGTCRNRFYCYNHPLHQKEN